MSPASLQPASFPPATFGLRRRPRVRWVPAGAAALAALAGLSLAAIVGFLVIGASSGPLSWTELLTSSTWDPSRGRFGASAMIFGTAAVALLAMAVAAPLGWATAIAIGELAPTRWRRALRAGSELLAVVPSIVYGLIGIAFVRPFVARVVDVPGGDSLVAAALVLAVMVLPTVVAVSTDALAGVPAATREAAAACGLTRTEVIRSAVLPLARRGMGAGLALGLARALGETIAVFLVVGRADGRFPSSAGDVLTRLVRPGQTLTTKLNGPESVLAGTSGPHWAALCALGLLLLGTVAVLTVAGQRRSRQGGTPALPRRWSRSGPRWSPLGRVGFDRLARGVALAALGVTLALVAAILVVVLARGSAALHPGWWWRPSYGASGGGVRDQVVGTTLLVAVAGLLAAPVGLGLGLVVSEYASPRLGRALRTATLALGGMPSILLGLWGYWLFNVRLGWGRSWLTGGIALALVALPPVVVAVTARIEALPLERREAALACGLRRDQVVQWVLVPHALPGLLTGTLLGLARAAGETAPLLFTAAVFSGAATLPSGVRDSPVSALSTHIFTLAQDSAEPAAARATWGAALALVMVAGLLVLAAVPARRRMERSSR